MTPLQVWGWQGLTWIPKCLDGGARTWLREAGCPQLGAAAPGGLAASLPSQPIIFRAGIATCPWYFA